MLRELKFVQGAVSRKDMVPALTHFAIDKGRVRGYNGSISLCSPVPLDLECKPKAETLVRAIGNCKDTIALHLTPAGRLSVRSGPFRALVDCIDGETPHVEPEGDRIDINGADLLAAVKALSPFIGDDASRPWSNGVLLRNGSAFATNNVCVCEFWLGEPLPIVVTLPLPCIKEMLRIDEAPTHMQATETSVTLHYEGDRWLRTNLLPTDWPDFGPILDHTCEASPVPPSLFEGLRTLKPFCDKLGSVYIKDGVASTTMDASEGTCFDLPGMPHEGRYNVEMMLLLEGVAESCDWSRYPKPCLFYGDRLRGAIVGMHWK